MKKLILLLMVLVVSLFAKPLKPESVLAKELTKLDKGQQELLFKSYIYAEQNGYGYTLTAVAWKESNFGKIVANPKEGKYGTYGPYQSKVEDVLARNHLKPTKDNIAKVREQLLHDLKFAANDAIIELKAWDHSHAKKKKVNVYRSTLAAYNAGTAAEKSSLGKGYAEDIVHRLPIVKKYIMSKPELLASYKEHAKTIDRLSSFIKVSDPKDIRIILSCTTFDLKPLGATYLSTVTARELIPSLAKDELV